LSKKKNACLGIFKKKTHANRRLLGAIPDLCLQAGVGKLKKKTHANRRLLGAIPGLWSSLLGLLANSPPDTKAQVNFKKKPPVAKAMHTGS
jgi:hypothetical protein